MTACSNKRGRAGRVITAALVGALSVGAPAVALATTGGISTLSVDPATAFANAEISAAAGSKGTAVSDFEDMRFVAGTNEYPVVTELTIGATGQKIDVTDSSKYEVTYQRYVSGDTSFVGDPATYRWDVAKYKMTIEAVSGPYAGGEFTVDFNVVAADLADAYVFDTSEQDVSDTELVYNASAQTIGIAVDGVDITSLLDITYYNAGSDQGTATAPTDAGSYVAKVSGKSDTVYEGKTRDIAFTVEKLDLSSAEVKVAEGGKGGEAVDVTMSDSAPVSIWADGVNLTAWVTLTFKSAENGDKTYSADTRYTYTVAVNSSDPSAAKNVEGTKDVTFDKVATKVYSSSFKYDRKAFGSVFGTANPIDLSDPKADYFNPAKIEVAKGGEHFSADELSVWYTDSEGNAATEADLKTPGNWLVHVQVSAPATEWAYGSDAQTINVIVKAGDIISDESVYFTYNGDVVSDNLNKTYTGADYAEGLDAVVKFGDKTLTEGADYTLTIEKKDSSTGKWGEVDSIVDAGEYRASVTSDTYEVTGVNSIDIHVSPVTVTQISAQYGSMITVGDKSYIPYTGSDIAAPTITYAAVDEDGQPVLDEGKQVKATLPADAYSISLKYQATEGGAAKAVEAMNEIGFYTPTVELADGCVNFSFSDTQLPVVEVSDDKVYSDVLPTAWYAQSVADAYSLGYVKGIEGTSFFKPESNITRGEAVVILYRMAGADDYYDGKDLNKIEDLNGYATAYGDVDPNAFYAKAIAWATKLDIAHGNDGEFRPDDSITTEQWTALLANYAKATLSYEDVDAEATLAKFADGAEVSDWAKDAVAWAAANGVIGNNGADLKPQDSIYRARVAAMAVNYQPEKLDDAILGNQGK